MAKAEYTAPARDIRKDLERLGQELELVQAGLLMATAALKHQKAECDVDFARILECDVSRRLFEQMDLLKELTDSLPPSTQAPAAGERQSVSMQ